MGEEATFPVYYEATTALWWSFLSIDTQSEPRRTHWQRALQENSKGELVSKPAADTQQWHAGSFFPSGVACFT